MLVALAADEISMIKSVSEGGAGLNAYGDS